MESQANAWVYASGAEAEALEARLPSFAGERGVLLAVHGRGPGTPWEPSPAVVGTVTRMLARAHIPTIACAWGRAPAPALAAIIAERQGLSSVASWVELTLCGTQEVARVPSTWFGRHLVALVPCVLHRDRARESTPQRHGPLASLWMALASACGVRPSPCAAPAGAEIASVVFAGVTVMVDGTQVVIRSHRGAGRPGIAALQRNFTVTMLPATLTAVRNTTEALDHWCAAQIDSSLAQRGPDLHLFGPAAVDPWPMGSIEPWQGHQVRPVAPRTRDW